MVHYRCPHCKYDFVVFHEGKTRNTHCNFCRREVEQTGVVEKLEGDYVVVYENNVEIDRFLRKDFNRKS